MMKTTNSLFFTLFSSSLLLLIFLTVPGVNGDLLTDTCKKISDKDPQLKYEFCVTSLQADPNSQTANLQELGAISINLISANVTFVHNRIRQLLKKGGGDPSLKGYLQVCREVYSDAISDVKDAIDDFKSGLYREVNVKLSSVATDSMTCEDGFQEVDGLVSPLTKENDNVSLLSGIGLSIANML